MNNEQLEKKLFETALRHAVEQCVEEECAPIREKYADSPEPDYSPGFRLRMKRLLQKNKHPTGAGWQTYAKRVAAVAVVFCVGFFSVMTVDALRIPITNFFLSITEKSTVIDFGGSNDNMPDIPDGWDFVYAPAYLPEGFVLTKTDFYGNSLEALYSAGEKQEFYFTQSQSFEGGLSFDTEDAVTENILVGRLDGIYAEKDGRSTLFWSNKDCWFTLTTKLGREETIKIAKSVEKIKK